MSPIQLICSLALLGRCAGQCSASYDEDCSQTRCCQEASMTCWRKNADWAECKPSCKPGIDLYEKKGGGPWLCEKLVSLEVAVPMRDLSTCSASYTDNCQSTGCCKSHGMKCFEKDQSWAACKSSCTPGVDAHDMATFKTPWSCKVLTVAARTAGQPTPSSTPPLVRPSQWALQSLDAVSAQTPAAPVFLEKPAQSSSPFLAAPADWSPPASAQVSSQPTARHRVITFFGLYWPQVVCGVALLSSFASFAGVAVLWWQNPMCILTAPPVHETTERIRILE